MVACITIGLHGNDAKWIIHNLGYCIWFTIVDNSFVTDKTSLKEIVKDGIDLQKSSLEYDSDTFVRIKDPDNGNEVHHSSAAAHASRLQHHVVSSVKDVLGEAAIHLQLAYKRNTLLPYFFGIGMVSMATRKQKPTTKELGNIIFFNSC